MPRARIVLEQELPDVVAACLEAGAAFSDPLVSMPPTITDRAPRPGDDRFRTLNVRRAVVEQVLARIADAEPGLTVRRGAAVERLLTTGLNGSARITGVRAGDGGELAADLVVDAMGRGSRLPRLLVSAGLDPGTDEVEAGRFVYYTRFFRGTEPVLRAPRLCHIGSLSIVTIPGDSGTWSVTLFAAAGDRALKRLRDPRTFAAAVGGLPRHAHWLEGEPISGVLPMGGVTDRLRAPAPSTPGVLSVGDAWGCTNPSLGRGIAIGLMHVALLREVVRERLGDGLEAVWRERTEAELGHFHRAVVDSDRARLAVATAYREGREPPAPRTPAERVAAALPQAMGRDPDVFRAGLEIIGCLAPAHEVVARPGFAARVLALGGTAPPPPELERDALLDLIAA
jgi:2-polyprenyl-6-methoxyphenol hydroxylase-like FAD-dependent oxidoreductase